MVENFRPGQGKIKLTPNQRSDHDRAQTMTGHEDARQVKRGPVGQEIQNLGVFMKLKVMTGIALFFIVFMASDSILTIFKDVLGHDIVSASIGSIFVYKLEISILYALSAVVALVAVSPGFISSSKAIVYFTTLAVAIVFTTGWLLFRLFVLRSYLQDLPSDVSVPSFSLNIQILNKIILNANIFVLSLLALAFGYMWFTQRRKVS